MSGPSDARRTYGAAVAKEIAKSVMEAETKNLPQKSTKIWGQNDPSLDRIEAIRRLVAIGLKGEGEVVNFREIWQPKPPRFVAYNRGN